MLTLLHNIFISQLNRPTNPLRIFQRKFVTCVAVRRCINNRYLSSQQFEALGRAHTHTQLEALRRSEAFVSWCACAQPLRPTALIDCALTTSLFPLLPPSAGCTPRFNPRSRKLDPRTHQPKQLEQADSQVDVPMMHSCALRPPWCLVCRTRERERERERERDTERERRLRTRPHVHTHPRVRLQSSLGCGFLRPGRFSEPWRGREYIDGVRRCREIQIPHSRRPVPPNVTLSHMLQQLLLGKALLRLPEARDDRLANCVAKVVPRRVRNARMVEDDVAGRPPAIRERRITNDRLYSPFSHFQFTNQ